MTSNELIPEQRFVCYMNGALAILSFAVAHAKLWICDLGWVVPIRWYRYKLGKHADSFYFDEHKIGRSEEDFAFWLHAKRVSPVTAADLFDPDRHSKPLSRNSLIARAHRFAHKTFGKLAECHRQLLPFEPVDVPTSQGKRRFGYQVKRGRTRLMIVELHQTGERGRIDFDWSLFLIPPGGSSNTSDAA